MKNESNQRCVDKERRTKEGRIMAARKSQENGNGNTATEDRQRKVSTSAKLLRCRILNKPAATMRGQFLAMILLGNRRTTGVYVIIMRCIMPELVLFFLRVSNESLSSKCGISMTRCAYIIIIS